MVQIVKVDNPRFVLKNLAFLFSAWTKFFFRTDTSFPASKVNQQEATFSLSIYL
jgi:hypothetical protein